jgi:hypothetical protein
MVYRVTIAIWLKLLRGFSPKSANNPSNLISLVVLEQLLRILVSYGALVKAITFCARAFGCVAHAREEVEREKGWRASTTVQVIQPLDLELQGLKYYDGPKDRVFPKNRT